MDKFTIEHIFPANPMSCLFKANVFLQQSRSLTKDGDLEAFDDMLSKMKSTAPAALQEDGFLVVWLLVWLACAP